MAYYECVYLARQDIASSQVEALTDSFAEIVANGGGEIKKREYWGLRNLAYRVKKNRKAHYVLLNIDAPAEALHEMQRIMRLNDDVLRDLTLRVDELNEGPSTMMQRREERRDRGDRRGSRDDRGEKGERDTAKAADADAAKEAKAAEEKPAEEKPTEEKPAAEKPAETAKAADADDAKPAEEAKAPDSKAEDTKAEDTKAEDTKAEGTKTEGAE